MEQLIAQIADALGYPAELVERSAAARATALGVDVGQVLQQWAGGEAPVLTESAPAAPAAASPAAAAAEAEPAAAAPSGPEVEVLAPVAEAASEDDDADAAEPAPPEPSSARAPAGSVLSGFPRWLVVAFVIIPAIAMLYLLRAPDGPDCGVSGQLAIDPVSGEAVNCDGTPYGADVINYFAMGQEIYDLRCAACHGADGGGGAGQVLAGGAVLASFPAGQCDSHAEWVGLGTAGWPEATYGALSKPVGGFGLMPAFEGTLTEEEIASVVLYERVAFGGETLPETEADCGLGDEEVSAAP